MKILVTGSSGMIGSELAQTLEGLGHEVWGLDKNHPAFVIPKNFLWFDLTHPVYPIKLPKLDFIIHLAANARVHDLVIEPQMALDNVTMTFNILEYARKSGCPKLIFASSREVYGNGNEMPVAEDVGSQRTSESPYSSSKLAGESFCHSYRKCYGIDTKIVRFSNVYGKYDFSSRFIPKVIRQLEANEPIEIWGKDKVLDFTYLTDAVQGVCRLIKVWPEENEFNIAYGKGETLVNVAEKLRFMMGSLSEIFIKESKTGEVTEYTADISRMQSIGYWPKVGINEGLRKAVKYYENH